MKILLQLCHFTLPFPTILLLCNHARWCYSLAYEEVMLYHSRQRHKSFCSLTLSQESTFGCMFKLLFALQFCSLDIYYPDGIWASRYPSVMYFSQIIFILSSYQRCLTRAIIIALSPLTCNFSFAWIIWVRWLSGEYIHKIKLVDNIPFSHSTFQRDKWDNCCWWFVKNHKTEGQ